MKRARFTTEQIIAIHQEHRTGATAEVWGGDRVKGSARRLMADLLEDCVALRTVWLLKASAWFSPRTRASARRPSPDSSP